MEASLRFAGPETLETKIFGRLTAWQNWIFQRPNAVGEQGALKLLELGNYPTMIKTCLTNICKSKDIIPEHNCKRLYDH